MDDLLRYLLTASADAPEIESVADAWDRHVALAERFTIPVHHAAAAGFGTDRLGYAFLSGYRAALQRLWPALPPQRTAALCATEEGGGHPRAIRTTLRDGKVSGVKTFVTLGSAADVLVVIATEGDGLDGRPRLRAVCIDARAEGVTLTDRPPLPFAPEIPHAVVTLTEAAVAEELPGDAYERYLKPFRTIEDVHVLAAATGLLVRVARRNAWPEAAVERLVVILGALDTIANADPAAPQTHIALGGLHTLVADSLASFEKQWTTTDAPTRERWERDRPLLGIASAVRAKRLESAWHAVG